MKNARDWIEALGLQPHPEGGFFRETYRSVEKVSHPGLPERYQGERAWGTSIYFLLESGNPSHFHRLKTDEIWHFYAGMPLTVHQLAEDGAHREYCLGPDFALGERFQHWIPAGTWFGAEVKQAAGYALIGCTLAPGFEFSDFELGQRSVLLVQYPQHKDLIEKMTLKAAATQTSP